MCAYVYMCDCMYMCVSICMYVYVNMCVYVCKYTCMYAYVCAYIHHINTLYHLFLITPVYIIFFPPSI